MAETNLPEEQLDARKMPLMIHSQYVKDISFENPNAPATLMPGRKGPEMDININMSVREVEDEKTDNLYEVTLILSAKATREDTTYFLAEIHYGALVSLNDIPEKQHHPMLFIEVPRSIFPFARQILSDMTAQGGYPPLLLNPVDFHAMYMERFAKDMEDNQGNGNGQAA